MQGHRIEPHAMMRHLAYGIETPTWPLTAAFLCSQCGLCEFACPMDLSPRRAFAEIAKGFRAAGVKNPHTAQPKELHQFNRFRKIGKKRLINRYQLSEYDSHDLPLTELKDVECVGISLTQSIGAPSTPVVKEGDTVKRGDLIAKIDENKLGANHHSPINGRVIKVDSRHILIEGEK